MTSCLVAQQTPNPALKSDPTCTIRYHLSCFRLSRLCLAFRPQVGPNSSIVRPLLITRSTGFHMPIDRDRIARTLTERGAVRPCSRCGHANFAVIDGYSNLPLQDQFNGSIVIGGPGVPVAIVACANCGAITTHALGPLPNATGQG